MRPQICDVFEVEDGHRYRITGYLKKVESSVWRWEFTDEDNATHVSGSGVCGCIRPIDEVVIVGNMDGKWSVEAIQEAKDSVKRSIGERV